MLNLIREAEAANRLKALGAQRASEVKAAAVTLGVSVVDLVESDYPSTVGIEAHDYDMWLNVLQSEATERGINLKRRQQFVDLAWDMLSNDPHIDGVYGGAGAERDAAVTRIVTALWKIFQAHGATAGVPTGVTPPQENEEFVDTDSAEVTDDEPADDDAVDDEVTDSDTEESEVPSDDAEVELGDDEDQEAGEENPHPEGSLRHTLWAAMIGGRDWPNPELLVNTPDEEVEATVSDDGGEADLPTEDSEADPESDDGEEESAEDIASRLTKGDKHFEDEEQTTSSADMFKQVLTTPGNPLQQAVKDVEAEGADAWAGIRLPMNPHPPKSKAHAAWARGLTKAAQSHLGIQPPKPVQKKPTKKR